MFLVALTVVSCDITLTGKVEAMLGVACLTVHKAEGASHRDAAWGVVGSSRVDMTFSGL